MLFPIGDDNSQRTIVPWVTWGLIAVNVLVFLYESVQGESFVNGFSVIPYEITHGVDLVGTAKVLAGDHYEVIRQYPGPPIIYLTLLTSMFMHASWLHIGGNMLYLWIFGDNVEDAMGHGRFLIFYIICGLCADFSQIAVDPNSVVPNLGASGAIAGALGAYVVLYPTNRIRVIVPIFLLFITTLPAVIVIGLWFVLQLISGYGAIATTQQSSGVAFMAHVGGFIAGALLVFVFRRKRPQPPPAWQTWN
ncbi:MAG TPA: rhomboid family intramembrane serine protease [Blastocatellia bacterium]|nr:rhomboid family intramembrane serine protease [Blastocatellia bacterium]